MCQVGHIGKGLESLFQYTAITKGNHVSGGMGRRVHGIFPQGQEGCQKAANELVLGGRAAKQYRKRRKPNFCQR